MDSASSLRRKVTWRLLAPLTFLILLSSVDRSNIAVAALRMNHDIGLSPEMYGRGAGLFFFLGYIALQYPHTALLRRIGARAWIAGAVTVWGCIAAAGSLVTTPDQFYLVRFLLGVAEGGFAPGAAYLAASWTPPRRHAAAITATMLAIPLSQIVGAPVSGWLMSLPGTSGGVAGWRLMLGAEGAVTVACGLLSWFVFVDRLTDARWLTSDERAGATDMNASAPPGAGGVSFMGDAAFWGAAGLWFCLLAGAQGLLFWMAQVVKQTAGGGALQVGLVTALPWIGVAMGMLGGAWSSDRSGERNLHLAVAAFVASAALLAAYSLPHSAAAIPLLLLGGAGLGAAQAAFWPIPIARLGPGRAGRGITVINMAGNLAGLLMTPLIGIVRQRSGSFDLALYLLVAVVALAGVIALVLRAAGASGATSRSGAAHA